jgi:conjugal transfer mating pair stabilization protein TraG
MVNFWRDAPGSLATAVENTSAAQLAIAQSQAQASANSAYLTMAAVAEGALPKIRNVVQIIIIAIFPIVLILVLMAGHKGGVVLKSYVMAMVWIELWPVLYAVTSYVAHLAAAPGVSSGLIGGLAGVPAGPGLSLLNSINIEDTLLRDEAVAGMFSLLIPVMAYAILKGGEVAMSGLASQLMAPATGAAQKAGGEAGLGNLSMGNVRYDTFAARTSMANSWSTRPSIDSGIGGRLPAHGPEPARSHQGHRVGAPGRGDDRRRHAGGPGHPFQPGRCAVRRRRHRCGKHQP